MPSRTGTHNCLVCRHPHRTEIEAARDEALSYPALAVRFGVVADSIRSHFAWMAKRQAEAVDEGPGDDKRQQLEPER